MAERYCGRQRDDVTAEQRQVHTRLTLRHPVAHCRHTTRDLRRGADLACGQLDLLGVAPVRLMRRQHVIVSSDDADIGRGTLLDRAFVLA